VNSLLNDLPQLEMVWPQSRLTSPPLLKIPPNYILREYQPGDELRFYEVMALSGWLGWDDKKLEPWLKRIPPRSWFMLVYQPEQKIVATAMGLHDHTHWHPFGSELGWVASDPDYRGIGLGAICCSAVVRRLLAAGYTNIHLYTEDFRLAALKTYLLLGFTPRTETPAALERWRIVCAAVGSPFTPDLWHS